MGLETGAHTMHLLLQKPNTWSRARRARAERRRAGAADLDTLWEDETDSAEVEDEDLLPTEGDVLHLRGAEHSATTIILSAQPFPSGRRPGTVLVTCRRVNGLPFPLAHS